MSGTNTKHLIRGGNSCASSKSFVFISLIFISLFSLHAVAKHVVDSFAEPVAQEEQRPAPVLTPKLPEKKVIPENVDGKITPPKPVYAKLESRKPDTLWNPISRVWLSDEQVQLLKLTYDIGVEEVDVKHARTLQAILMQETHAGLMGRIGHLSAPVGKRSYGVMQVKVSAASDVLKRHPELGKFKSVEELIAKLLTDDEFNIRVASRHIQYLTRHTKTDAHTLMAYNIGLKASKRHKSHTNFRYVKGVKRYYAKIVMPFNKKFRAKPKGAARA